MQQVSICLASPERVQSFVKRLSALNGDFELLSGSHILDARSLMGVFTLDLSRPLQLKIYDDCPENLDAIAPYLWKEGEPHHG